MKVSYICSGEVPNNCQRTSPFWIIYLLQDRFVPVYYSDDKDKDCKEGTGTSCESIYMNGSGISF